MIPLSVVGGGRSRLRLVLCIASLWISGPTRPYQEVWKHAGESCGRCRSVDGRVHTLAVHLCCAVSVLIILHRSLVFQPGQSHA